MDRNVRQVDHHAVIKLIRQDAQLVDVLPAHEYRSAHLPGAIHLPLKRLIDEASQRLIRDRPVVVYCRDAL